MIVAGSQISASGAFTLPTTATVLLHPNDALRMNVAESSARIEGQIANALEQLGKRREFNLIAAPVIIVAEAAAAPRGFPLVDAVIEGATSAATSATMPISGRRELRALSDDLPDLLLSPNEPLTGGRSCQPKVPAKRPFGCGFAQKFDSQRNFP